MPQSMAPVLSLSSDNLDDKDAREKNPPQTMQTNPDTITESRLNDSDSQNTADIIANFESFRAQHNQKVNASSASVDMLPTSMPPVPPV